MVGLGIGLFFGGYSLLYYGLSQVTGHNYGFLDLVVPSRWAAAELNPPPNDQAAAATPASPIIKGAAQAVKSGKNAAESSSLNPEPIR